MGKMKYENTERIKPAKRRKRLWPVAALILLVAMATGGWFYTSRVQTGYPKTPLPFVDLDDAVLRFAWEQMPDIYDHLAIANTELALMTDEIGRIQKVGSQFPRQEKIVTGEVMRWEKSVQKLTGQLQRFQDQVEALYVIFQVNPEKGRTAIGERRTELEAAMEEVLTGVEEQTKAIKEARVAPTGIKGFIATLKARFQ